MLALGVKRKEDLLEILPLGKTVQSFCLEEICMEHCRENMSSMTLFCNKTKMWKILSWLSTRKLKEKLCTVLSTTKVNLCSKSQVVTLTVCWVISTVIKRAEQRILEVSIKSGVCEVNGDWIWDLGERCV